MDSDDVRRRRHTQFVWLHRERFGSNAAALARALGKDAPYVRFRLHPEKPGGRWIGERLAREIELKLDLGDRWMDGPADGLHSALDDWRLQASARSQRVIDQLTLLARKNELSDADWALIEDLAARFRKKEPPK